MNSSPMAPPVSKEFAASGYLFEQVRRAATAKGRADARVFVAEGQRLLERALRAGWLPRALLLGQSAACEPELAALLERWPALQPLVQRVPDVALLELAEGRRSGLVTALFDLPDTLAIATLLERRAPPAVFLVVVDVDDTARP